MSAVTVEMPIASIECVVYQREPYSAMDSHGGADIKTNKYTIVANGEYIFSYDSKVFSKKTFKAGATIALPQIIMRSSCGIFYSALEKRVK